MISRPSSPEDPSKSTKFTHSGQDYLELCLPGGAAEAPAAPSRRQLMDSPRNKIQRFGSAVCPQRLCSVGLELFVAEVGDDLEEASEGVTLFPDQLDHRCDVQIDHQRSSSRSCCSRAPASSPLGAWHCAWGSDQCSWPA
jgi:hypothetical protein